MTGNNSVVSCGSRLSTSEMLWVRLPSWCVATMLDDYADDCSNMMNRKYELCNDSYFCREINPRSK